MTRGSGGQETNALRAGDLELFVRVLQEGHYNVDLIEFDDLGSCVLAETTQALVLCVVGKWETLERTVSDAQAQLTHVAARAPSPRNWDLYVVVGIPQVADESHEVGLERIEHDTRYARKFVVAGPWGDDDALRRALRPLLPLRSTARVHLDDPLSTMQAALLARDQDQAVVDRALSSYRASDEVEII
ncbi:MAG: hypothetical protein ACRDLN_00635 [Solirubrobacteraceae bacterium]